ncbi:Arabinan endo-1,5-alpha-L-arabinosidase A [Cytospora mali]|uniref:Arabinan endo-1,5-alpha-L-arabinosidase n=1 Tax=Cytospora mali TaxID=578113 RepID=A0A194VF84_CYTMA|nr:Arabinan endo-1,5-alpha-L-arabinosidase A [Valsa mali var. pyri (nom. inval.)]
MFLGSIISQGTATLLLGLAAIPTYVQASYPSPESCSGYCWAHDPAVVKRSDGTYFRFNTGSEIGISTASALTGPWTYQGSALPSGSSIDLSGNTDLWAPYVQLIDDTYYLYYAVSTFGSQDSAIGYATSSTMEYGSWTDHGSTGIASTSSKPYNAIDPALIEAEDGNYYMSFGSFWDDIYQAEMKDPPTAVSASSYQIAYNSSGDHAMEGSFIYYRSPYYYLFFSAGICCGYDTDKPAAGEEYSIRVCRSSAVSGPYVDATGASCIGTGGTMVLASHGVVYGPGGQGVLVDTAYDGAVLYYHYANTNDGIADADYLFGFNKISWSTGWPVLTS